MFIKGKFFCLFKGKHWALPCPHLMSPLWIWPETQVACPLPQVALSALTGVGYVPCAVGTLVLAQSLLFMLSPWSWGPSPDREGVQLWRRESISSSVSFPPSHHQARLTTTPCASRGQQRQAVDISAPLWNHPEPLIPLPSLSSPLLTPASNLCPRL